MDSSKIFFHPVKMELEAIKLDNNQPEYILVNFYNDEEDFETLKKKADESVINKNVSGYAIIKNGGTDSIKIEYRSESAANFRDIKRIESAVNEARINLHLTKSGIDKEILSFINKNVETEEIQITKEGTETKADFLTIFFSSIIFIILLMMMVIYSGQMLVRSLIEEKSNRLIEILISSCTADELLAGKVAGLSALNLFQIFIWILIALGLMGAALIPPEAFNNILPIFFYFVIGFIFYTALFVGVGAIVTTEQEAQQVTSYVSILLVLPVIFAFTAIENPGSSIIQTLSYVPFTIPSVMILRLNISPVPLSEIFLTSGIMITSIILTVYVAAKIFRIGILSYGKTPSLKELKEWIKEK
jgi:ABC-2 type transport system permease protein